MKKVSAERNEQLSSILKAFYTTFPRPDDDLSKSCITQIVISPFDHWLSVEEAELEIRMFGMYAKTPPTQQSIEKFNQHEAHMLNYLSEYLKLKEFYYVKTLAHENKEGDYEFESTFYECSNDYDFYQFVNDSMKPQLFLPNNIDIEIDDDYTFHFRMDRSNKIAIHEIMSRAEEIGLNVLHQGDLLW